MIKKYINFLKILNLNTILLTSSRLKVLVDELLEKMFIKKKLYKKNIKKFIKKKMIKKCCFVFRCLLFLIFEQII